MRAVIFQPGQKPELIDVDPTLKNLQAIVGGDIESVMLRDFPDVHGFINEDGKARQLPPNDNASTVVSMWPGDFIAGTMICLSLTEDGDEAPVSDEFVAFVEENTWQSA